MRCRISATTNLLRPWPALRHDPCQRAVRRAADLPGTLVPNGIYRSGSTTHGGGCSRALDSRVQWSNSTKARPPKAMPSSHSPVHPRTTSHRWHGPLSAFKKTCRTRPPPPLDRRGCGHRPARERSGTSAHLYREPMRYRRYVCGCRCPEPAIGSGSRRLRRHRNRPARRPARRPLPTAIDLQDRLRDRRPR